jgi:hypothetical protein
MGEEEYRNEESLVSYLREENEQECLDPYES